MPLRPAIVLLLALLAACTTPPAPPPSPAGAFNVLGRADAPVAIVEFTDLQCPYCARYATQTFPELRRNYIETGKVRYASRDLPLPFHPYAMSAAVACRCAGEQGRFWEYRHALFERQPRIGAQLFDGIAQELGLDRERFAECRRDGRQEAGVRADLALAQSQGIDGTPTFAIGRVVDGVFQGETFTGAKPYAEFAARIDALLATGD